MSIAAGLEIGSDGWCIVHFPAVPGAGFKAPGIGEAMRAAPACLADELEWLAVRGLGPWGVGSPWSASRSDVPGDPPGHSGDSLAGPAVTILETIRTRTITASGDNEAYFSWCGQPLTRELVEEALSLLAAGREHLLAMVGERGKAWLETRPAPGKRSPREALHHLADAELFYLVRLSPSQTEARENWKEWSGRGQPELERIATIRSRLVDALTGLADSSRARITVHDPHAELWSPLKIAYRAIWHERYTTRSL